jgi:NADH-quinone oxidoreductase subunit H
MDLAWYWTALIAFVVVNFFMVSASVLVYAERKVSGYMQNRPGPNRVGPFGFLQPFADVVKLVFKENIVPALANPFVHSLAPLAWVIFALGAGSLIPYAKGVAVADMDVSVLVMLALTSISVYGVTLAGWSSNSKYSLLGGLRSSAQMISYELSMGLAVLSVVLIAGSLNMATIVEDQAGGWGILGWNVFRNPIGAILFIVTAFAETNRAPFDLPEAEQELVGGYHTEYSGMKFGMFFLAEYVNFFVASFFIVTMFFGGYMLPFESLILAQFPGLVDSVWLMILQLGSVLVKAGFFAYLFIWVRWTLPRFKYQQLMTLGWKVLLPLALVNAILVAFGVIIFS